MVAPGENGLLIGTVDDIRRGMVRTEVQPREPAGPPHAGGPDRRRAARHLGSARSPVENEETGVRIRRARPDESRLLTRLERAASEEALAHIFPPQQYPYPVSAIAQRWRQLLEQQADACLPSEVRESPVGYVAFDAETVHHLGVVPDHHTSRLRLDLAGVCVHGDLRRRRPGRVLLGAQSTITRHVRSTVRRAGMRPASGRSLSFRRILSHSR